jgi:hypothetical protein
MIPAVGSKGSTLSGCPSSTRGIWCAASQSGIAAANAPSIETAPPPVILTTAAGGTSSA